MIKLIYKRKIRRLELQNELLQAENKLLKLREFLYAVETGVNIADWAKEKIREMEEDGNDK